jgi:hypothetical protein
MGELTTFTVYNDSCDQIIQNPKEFAEEIYNACRNSYINYRRSIFYGAVILQKTRHADDRTIYVHAGNTVCEMNSDSDTTKELMTKNPRFFEEMLKLMEFNVIELKKQFNNSYGRKLGKKKKKKWFQVFSRKDM